MEDDGGRGRADHRRHAVRVAQVDLVQHRLRSDVLPPPRGEVVEHVHVVPARQQRVDEVGSDEAGTAGHEGSHRRGDARPGADASLGRLHQHRARDRAATARRAARGGRPRGRADRAAALPHHRAARAVGPPAHGDRPPRRRAQGRQGARRRQPHPHAHRLGAQAALRLGARARLDRHAGRLPPAADPEHDDVRLRVGGAAAPRQLPAREPRDGAGRDPARAARPLRRQAAAS